MVLNKACTAQPGHKDYKKNRAFQPVVISSKRYDGIISRSRQDDKLEKLAAIEEEQRYKQYLKDGSDALCSLFTNMGPHVNDDDELQANRDKALAERAKNQMTKHILDELRKERIMRANMILNRLKPGPRALHQALLESELIHQRKFNQALNIEIAENAKRQERLDEQQCPEMLIPFGHVTEQQEKAEQQKKALEMRAYYLKDLEERRQRKKDEKEQEMFDCIVERAQYKCLQEKEEKAAKELKKKKREFCRSAYCDAVEEKAEIANAERIFDKIDDRIICVDVTAQRTLNARNKKQIKDMRAKQIREHEARAQQVGRLQQADKRKDIQEQEEERYEAELQIDEARRQCEIQELSKQRRAYQLVEFKRGDEKRQRDAEMRRFEIATRFKNAQANHNFETIHKRRQEKITADLRKVLLGQREQFLEQRQNEMMRITACQEDPYLQEDVKFFDETVKLMKESQELGRPLYPLAKAAEEYKRENQLDMVPEGKSVRRSKLRDYCWPGYFSKAELAYRKYEHREKCREEQEKERHRIFGNCIRITKMASEQSPYKPCITECPIKCLHHRGMPPIESVASFDCGKNVCYEDDPPAADCPSNIQVIKTDDNDLACKQSLPCSKLKSQAAIIQKTPSIHSEANSKRVSGGKHPSCETVSPALNRCPKKLDLTRFWTAKPQAQIQAKHVEKALPAINSTIQKRSKFTWPEDRK